MMQFWAPTSHLQVKWIAAKVSKLAKVQNTRKQIQVEKVRENEKEKQTKKKSQNWTSLQNESGKMDCLATG